jgi:3-deoxy-D-manno-octulosonic-acid transferase
MFIIDTIGILTKIYSYADIAFVVVVSGNLSHNLLEPATLESQSLLVQIILILRKLQL